MSGGSGTEEGTDTAGPAWPPPGARPRIGEMLLAEGLISPDHLQAALELQRQTGLRLGETIVTLGFVSSYDVARVLARRLEVEFVDLRIATLDPEVVAAVPEEVARRYRALPVTRRDEGVLVAMCDPRDVFAIDDLRMLLGGPVVAALADPGQIGAAIQAAWSSPVAVPARVVANQPFGEAAPRASTQPRDDGPADELVDAVLGAAIAAGASAVHFDPLDDGVRVRFRVDGVLRAAPTPAPEGHRSTISVMKILAGIDGMPARQPRVGRFSVTHDGRPVDVELVTVPADRGECAVLHLLAPPSEIREVGALGFSPGQQSQYEEAIGATQGLVILAGPAGSGISTTLSTTAGALDRDDRSVVTLDHERDRRPRDGAGGVRHVRVDSRAGLTYPTALRSVLRADPDVLVVGRLGDPESARLAIEGALDGRVVISSLPARRAATVPLRLVDMGVEPFLVAEALRCVVAQRLARRLCPHCSAPAELDADRVEALRLPASLIAAGTVRRPVGCEECGGTGHHGRLALFEVMPMHEDIARLVTVDATAHDVERWAIADGMHTLRMTAIQRVADGVLGLDEMLRVLD